MRGAETGVDKNERKLPFAEYLMNLNSRKSIRDASMWDMFLLIHMGIF